jgi:Tat protein secretion system quality control protein TatD with DNase activity
VGAGGPVYDRDRLTLHAALPREKGEKRNDSAKVRRVVECIARFRGQTPEEVERQSWENGLRFFGIESPEGQV